MNPDSSIRRIWDSYWFRLLITSLLVGFIVGLMTLITSPFELGTVEYFIVLFVVLMVYGFLVEEPHLKSWRRENIDSIE